MRMLGCLSKCQICLGLMMLVLAGTADYVSHRTSTVRFHGLAEVAAMYFIIMGVVGIFGSASRRRGLVISGMVMGIHAVGIVSPAAIISSSFDIHFYKQKCWGECDWSLLSASIPANSRCQILCGDAGNENRRRSMSRLGTDYRLDAGLISLAGAEFFLSIAVTALCARQIFGTNFASSQRGGDSLASVANRANSTLTEKHMELQPLNKDVEDEKT